MRSSCYREGSSRTKYVLLGEVGSGTYGVVYKAEKRKRDDGDEDKGARGKRSKKKNREKVFYAVKHVKPQKRGDREFVTSMAALREIKLLRELRHRNVVRLEDVVIDARAKSLSLVYGYAKHDLHRIIRQHADKKKPIPRFMVKSIIWQLLKGVKYLHENWIIHRDLKPQNILIFEAGCVKIGDFGLARLCREPLKPLTKVERVVVTLWYRAPELLLGAKRYDTAIDVWALGCIFGELLALVELFRGAENRQKRAPFQEDQCAKIFRVLGAPSPTTWPGVERLEHYTEIATWRQERSYRQSSLSEVVSCSPEGNEFKLLAHMLRLDPSQRVTCASALKHAYVVSEAPPPSENCMRKSPKDGELQYPEAPLRGIKRRPARNDASSASRGKKERD